MESDRRRVVGAICGAWSVLAAMVLGVLSVADGLAIALGSIGVVLIAYAAWPRKSHGPVAISWVVSFGAALLLLWLGALDVLQLDSHALAATQVCIMVVSLVTLRLTARG